MNQTANSAMSVVVTVDAEVLSPTRITEKEIFDMSGFVNCRSDAKFELNWVAATAPSAPPAD